MKFAYSVSGRCQSLVWPPAEVSYTEAARDLSNTRVLALRAEEVTERFDWLVSRAVDPATLNFELAPRAAILASEGSIPLPWGKNRFIRDVPRGTC